MFLWPLVSPANKSADGRGRGVEDVHVVPVYDSPEAIGLGIIRRALVHKAGGAVLQWAVDNVTVPRDPANVGRAPEGVFLVEIEDPLSGDVGADGISAGGVHDPLRLAGRAGGVKDVERMLGIERLCRTL